MQTKFNIKSMVLLGLLMAIVVIFSMTPIGSIPIGPLVITMNVIPIGIAAAALGPWGGLIIGTFFGIFSFLQCFGIGVPSPMGAILLDINPIFSFTLCVISRAVVGLLAGLIFKFMSKKINFKVSCFITGFLTALLNTIFFMSTLVLLFGNTEYVQGLMGGKNVLLFIVTFVGVNAVVEMCVCCFATGAVGSALHAAKLIGTPKQAVAA